MYPSYSKRILGNVEDIPVTWIHSKKGEGNHKFLNNIVAYTDGTALHLRAKDCLVKNNLFHHIDLSCVADYDWSGSTIAARRCSNLIIRDNTIHTTGGSDAVRPGTLSITELNHIYNTGHLQDDGALVQLGPGAQTNSYIRYNWLHNSQKIAARFDGGFGGKNGFMHHNVVWEVGRGLMIKGDEHQVYHNTSFNNTLSNGIAFMNENSGNILNTNSILRNNLGEKIGGTRNTYDYLPGITSNNWNGYDHNYQLIDSLENYKLFDFRPKKNFSIINQGFEISGISKSIIDGSPDLGAYEYGDENYWIPGRKFEKASFPIPYNGANIEKTSIDLIWRGTYGGEENFYVYIGNTYQSVNDADRGSEQFLTSQKNNIYKPLVSFKDGKYFWRIDVEKASGEIIKGNVWNYSLIAENILVGIEPNLSNKDGQIILYPTPATDYLYLKSTKNNETIEYVEIFDLKGILVKRKEINSSEYKISIHTLRRGYYILRIKTKNQFVVKKALIN